MRIRKVLNFLLAGVPLLSAGCSHDNNNTTAETPRLIKKWEKTIYSSGNYFNLDFAYENGTLRSITDGDKVTQFTYSGNKVTKAEDFWQGSLVSTLNYTYQGDQLQSTISSEMERTDYYYSNGVLTSVVRDGTTTNYVFIGGNLTETRTSNDPDAATFYKDTYTNDNKNNPFKYINKYIRMTYFLDGVDPMNGSNFLTQIKYFEDQSVAGHIHFENIYDGNFPVQINKFREDGGLISKTNIIYY